MISVAEALERILARVPVLPPAPVPLSQALGLVLAEEVVADEDLPPFDHSAVDGYAVRSADLAAPATLEVVGEVFAGRMPDRAVGSGQALRIMTGGPMPEGADAAVMVEHTSLDGGRVEVRCAVRPGQNVRRAGENVRRGHLVLERGRVLGPAALGMAATLGRPTLLCHPRPRVAVLSTGDELVEPGTPLGPGQICNSNSYALEAQVRTAGGVPLRGPVLPDRQEALEEALRAAAAGSDMVLTSAGVSVGEHDFVKPAIERLGGELVFWKVRMRPGKPLAFGVCEGVPLVGLPGNPVSSMVGFEVFVRPALRRMAGHRDLQGPRIRARLAEPIEKVQDLRFFLRCRLDAAPGGGWLARSTGAQGSGILMSMLEADGLMDLPEGVARLEAGDEIDVRPLPEGARAGAPD